MDLTKIKALLKEVIKTGDEELIEMVTSLLKNEEQPKEETKPRKTENTNSDYGFTSEIRKGNKTGPVPVNTIKRFNSFVDDGTEAIGEEYKTPKITPTERKREPIKMINQTCKKCSKTVATHPTHKRDWFYCEKCLGLMGRL